MDQALNFEIFILKKWMLLSLCLSEMDLFDCSLWDFLKDDINNEITLYERTSLMYEIIEVIIFIHSKNYCHKDLKPSNIFLKTQLSGSKHVIIQKRWTLGDFGLCSKFSKLIGSSGTPCFGSMEQFDGTPHIKSDNYAIAKLAVILLFKWNAAWNFLASPISNDDYKKRPWKNNLIFTILEDLVQVEFIFFNDSIFHIFFAIHYF